MSEEDEWVRVAMSDDTLVVQLLLKLNQQEPPPQPLQPSLKWTVRQRRSKQVAPRKKAAELTRASPTTPLSWSGATSASGGAADGFEESSLPPKRIDVSRSKFFKRTKVPLENCDIYHYLMAPVRAKSVLLYRDRIFSDHQTRRRFVEASVTSETPTIKRSRKKKTLAELREEESLLLKERRNLNNQLASLRLTIEKQRSANESLKRIKLDLLSRQTPGKAIVPENSEEANSNQSQQIKIACDPMCSILPINAACNKLEPSPPNGSSQVKEVGIREPSFLVPDLNLPVDDDLGSDFL